VPATLVVRNARIYTADPNRPWAEAMACQGETIEAIGSDDDVSRRIGPDTEVLDAGGRLVLPGFIDAHVHLLWGYELGTWIDLTDRPSLEEVVRRVAAYAEAHPTEAILLGHGFDYAALKVEGLPRKEDLDAAVRDRPVLLTAWDGHTGVGNTRFVERALDVMRGLGHDVGEIQRDPGTGEPTGVFHLAFDVSALLPEVQGRRSLDGLRRTTALAVRFGITTACDVQVGLEDLHAYEALWKAGELPLRVRVALYHPADTPRGSYASFADARRRSRGDDLQIAAVKLYIDGVQETGTAALLDPYANDPASRGETVYSVESFGSIVEEFDRLGFQICTHACGDRGVRIALDAYERAAKVNGTSGRRHRIEHCENLAADDVPRFARLGVVPCMMPRHSSPSLTTRWREAVGPARTETAFPWRELLDAGASLAFASDWPVADMNPLVGIHEAVTRRTVDGAPSSHRISLEEAIDGYTRRAAFALHAESTRGSLEPGKYADFVVLSEDLFSLPPERIREARVLRAVVGGRTVHSQGPLA
jgi:hypothetical protein